MTINEALENTLQFLESLGYQSGDIHDDLAMAASRLRLKYPSVSKDEL